MRLNLSIEADDTLLPFAHQHWLVGTIHKWLGENSLHDHSSVYCFSRLSRAKYVKELNSLYLSDWTSIFIGAHDPAIVRGILRGIQKDPTMFKGLVVRDVTIVGDPDLGDREVFYPASPILLKKYKEGHKSDHILYSDAEANELLTAHFRSKLQKVGLSDDTVTVHFAPEEGSAKVMLVDYKGIRNKASWCPVRIEGRAESKLFAWNAGLGNSTGIGFGAIK